MDIGRNISLQVHLQCQHRDDIQRMEKLEKRKEEQRVEEQKIRDEQRVEDQ